MTKLPLLATIVPMFFQLHMTMSFVPPSHMHSIPITFVAPKAPDIFMRTDLQMSEEEEAEGKKKKQKLPIRRALLASSLVASAQFFAAQAYAPSGFKRIPTQFIAALGDPNASSGREANDWGLWKLDPGPRGVWLRDYKDLAKSENMAPAGWKFDKKDWWLEEHGLIMEAPDFPVRPGRYLVTGGRMVTTGLTVEENGSWKLDNGKLYDVTHLPCRSARYQPNAGEGSPRTAKSTDFPVAPGAEMPVVQGCEKQDYAVLFVIGVENV